MIFLFPIPYHIYYEGQDDLRIFFQIQDIWRTLKSKKVDMEPWTSHSMSYLKFDMLFDLPFFPFLSYSSWRSSGGPRSPKKEDVELWTSYSISNMKFKMLFYLPFSHSLSYLSWRSGWFQNILSNTRHLEDPEVKEGGYGALNLA